MFPKNYKEGIDTGFIPYILEASGRDDFVSTRTARINAAIKDFKSLVRQGKNPNEYIYEVLHSHGLSENLLTDAECAKIMRAVDGN